MAGNVTDWVASRLDPRSGIELADRSSEGFLIVKARDGTTFPVAVIGAPEIVMPEHVQPVLSRAVKPEFVVNVPSKAIWSGPAIDMVHGTPAAFGTLGEIQKAASTGYVPGYRNKGINFFDQAIRDHSNVRSVTRLYDLVFWAHRYSGNDLTIALVDAYNMSAEDLRNARQRYGQFDIAVKMTSYGSITPAARTAGASMGIEPLMYGEMLRRLAK
jgi:hypothetical protein